MFAQSPEDHREVLDGEAFERFTTIEAIKFWRRCRRPACRATQRCCSEFTPCWFDQKAEVRAATAALPPLVGNAFKARARRFRARFEWMQRDWKLAWEQTIAEREAGIAPPPRRRKHRPGRTRANGRGT